MTTEAKLKGGLTAYTEEMIETMREAIEYADLPLQTFALFMMLPLKGHVSLSQVHKLFKGLTHASVTRNVDLICGTSRLRIGGGYALAERFEDDQDRRNKNLQLTSAGRELRQKMHERGLRRFTQIVGEIAYVTKET